MALRSRSVLLALSLTAASCTARSGGSFTPPTQTVAIPGGAQLLLCSSAWSTQAGAPREVFAVGADGSGLTRLTFCNGEGQACDNVAVVASKDRARLAVVRIGRDSNGDGRLAPPDDAGLVLVDLARGVEAPSVPATERVRSVDWSPVEDLLVYGGRGSLSPDDEDLYRSGISGTDRTPLLASSVVRERNLRIDPVGQNAVFEQLDAEGRGSIWALTNTTARVTNGPSEGGPLPGSDYALGSDSAPDISPDRRQVVFRRLSGRSGALESWDVVVRTFANGSETVIVSGPAFRSVPDWGPDGIAFAENDGSQSRLVIVAPDGSNRRVPVTLPAGATLSSVRWLAAR